MTILLITFANSFYPDQARQNVWPDLDPKCLTLRWYTWSNFWKISFCRNQLTKGPQIRLRNRKLFFLVLNQNICCGYSKEPSHWDGSFEHPKHMFKLMDKKIITILRRKFLLNWCYVTTKHLKNYPACK